MEKYLVLSITVPTTGEKQASRFEKVVKKNDLKTVTENMLHLAKHMRVEERFIYMMAQHTGYSQDDLRTAVQGITFLSRGDQQSGCAILNLLDVADVAYEEDDAFWQTAHAIVNELASEGLTYN